MAFLTPVLERLVAARGESGAAEGGARAASAFAVILSPTRELSLQTLKVLKSVGHFCAKNHDLKFVGINGGESMEKQFLLLSSAPDVIVATPGRLSHHLSEIPDFHLRQVSKSCPRRAQSLLPQAQKLLFIIRCVFSLVDSFMQLRSAK